MGVGIAHVFAAHAVPTALVDASPELSEEPGPVPSSPRAPRGGREHCSRRDRDG
jgi:hypothetical protein